MMCIRNGRQDHAGEKDEKRVREEVRVDDQNRADDEMDRAGLPFAVDQVDGADRSEEKAEKEGHLVATNSGL